MDGQRRRSLDLRHVHSGDRQLGCRLLRCRFTDGIRPPYQLHRRVFRNDVGHHYNVLYHPRRFRHFLLWFADMALNASLVGWYWLYQYGPGDPSILPLLRVGGMRLFEIESSDGSGKVTPVPMWLPCISYGYTLG